MISSNFPIRTGGVNSINGVSGDVQIGGVNLLRNSDFANGLENFSASRGNAEKTFVDGLTVIKFTANNEAGEHYLFQTLKTLPPWFKGELTASVWVYTDESLQIDLFLQENQTGTLSDKRCKKTIIE